jgi:hypothetical protein
MINRKPRVYWFKGKKGQKDTLIFDAGYELGSIYVYELKESLLSTELDNQIEKYGYFQAWDITPSSDVP